MTRVSFQGPALHLAADLERGLDRLEVLRAAVVSTHGGDVDRSSVGEIEDRIGDRQTADLPAALPVRQVEGFDLGGTREIRIVPVVSSPVTSRCRVAQRRRSMLLGIDLASAAAPRLRTTKQRLPSRSFRTAQADQSGPSVFSASAI